MGIPGETGIWKLAEIMRQEKGVKGNHLRVEKGVLLRGHSDMEKDMCGSGTVGTGRKKTG